MKSSELSEITRRSHLIQSLPEPKLLDTILDHIGNTPTVRINRIGKAAGLQCELRKSRVP